MSKMRDFMAAVLTLGIESGWSLTVTEQPRAGTQRFTLSHTDGRQSFVEISDAHLRDDTDACQRDLLVWIQITAGGAVCTCGEAQAREGRWLADCPAAKRHAAQREAWSRPLSALHAISVGTATRRITLED